MSGIFGILDSKRNSGTDQIGAQMGTEMPHREWYVVENPQFIRSIWARHLSGKELHIIGKIAPIITYKMMLRRSYD